MSAQRLLVGFLLAAVCLGAITVPWLFHLMLLVIGLASLYELNRLCEIKGTPLEYPVAVVAVAAYIVLASLDLLHKWEGVLLAATTLSAFVIGMYGEQQGYFARTAYTVLATLYIGKLLTYFVFIRSIPDTGLIWTFFAGVTISLTDISGMLVGTMIGRHQLTRISPKKTVEGSLGALLIVTGLGTLASMWPAMHLLWWQGAVLAATTCIAAQAGDLTESALKRDAGVKDMGDAISGHGGVLDRFDSYLFGGTAFFAMLHVVGAVAIR